MNMLYLIFFRLGIPTEASWPGVTGKPEWNNFTSTLDPAVPLSPGGFDEDQRYAKTVGDKRELLPLEQQIFLNSMLVANPRKRLNLLQIINHGWLDSVRDTLSEPCLRAPQLEDLRCEISLLSHQTSRNVAFDLGQRVQNIIYTWLAGVQVDFHLTDRSRALAIYILERYCYEKHPSKEIIQLVGICALNIACTLLEKHDPMPQDYVFISDYSVTVKQIEETTQDVLKSVGVDLYIATGFDILLIHYLDYTQETKWTALTLLELSYYTGISVTVPANVIAIVCLILACSVTGDKFRHKTLAKTLGKEALNQAIQLYGKGLAIATSDDAMRETIYRVSKRGSSSVKTIISKSEPLTWFLDVHVFAKAESTEDIAKKLSQLSLK
jgi:hypothetical protein